LRPVPASPPFSLTDHPTHAISPPSLHDALPISHCVTPSELGVSTQAQVTAMIQVHFNALRADGGVAVAAMDSMPDPMFNVNNLGDRKSTRLNSSHRTISYAVFCLKKKKK